MSRSAIAYFLTLLSHFHIIFFFIFRIFRQSLDASFLSPRTRYHIPLSISCSIILSIALSLPLVLALSPFSSLTLSPSCWLFDNYYYCFLCLFFSLFIQLLLPLSSPHPHFLLPLPSCLIPFLTLTPTLPLPPISCLLDHSNPHAKKKLYDFIHKQSVGAESPYHAMLGALDSVARLRVTGLMIEVRIKDMKSD